MKFSIEHLGCNSGHLSPKKLQNMGYGMIETSLGKQLPYERMVEKNLRDLDEAKERQMAYSIHLPIYLSEAWRCQYDYYDSFYLDPSPQMREMCFELLQDNLQTLSKHYAPSYYVIHFPGGYPKSVVYEEPFEEILRQSLERLEKLAQTYQCHIALEYFGINERFSSPEQWIEAIAPYAHLHILLDTGHLYFTCFKNQYDYDTVLHQLAPHCIGFHLWNVFGTGFYSDSESYRQFHHIVPHLEQQRKDGWVFDSKEVIAYLAQFKKPLIIEAGRAYRGDVYFEEALSAILELLRNMT